MSKKTTHKQQDLTPIQVLGLRELGNIYIKYFTSAIKNENCRNFMSTNGEELKDNLNGYGLPFKRFFQSLEKRILREFDNVKDAYFDYDDFLSKGTYTLHLTYTGQTAESNKEKMADKTRTTKLSRNRCPALFNEYELGEKFKRKEISTLDILQVQFEEVPNSAETIARIAKNYCLSMGIICLSEQGYLEAFLGYQQRAFSKLYGHFHVEIVAPSFTEYMGSVDIPKSIEWKTLYDLVGECSGILVFPKGIMEYVITREGDFMRFLYNDYKRGRIMYSFENSFFRSLPDDEYKEFFINALNVLILKKFGSVEIQVIEGRGQRKFGKSYVVNKAPFPIHRLDGSWFKTIIRVDGFGVQGHWRLQACGKGWKEHKLVFIKPFQKHGYIRRARALVAKTVA